MGEGDVYGGDGMTWATPPLWYLSGPHIPLLRDRYHMQRGGVFIAHTYPSPLCPIPMYIVLTTNIFPFQHIFLSHVTIPYRGISYRWVTWDIPIPEDIPEGMEKELLEYLGKIHH